MELLIKALVSSLPEWHKKTAWVIPSCFCTYKF